MGREKRAKEASKAMRARISEKAAADSKQPGTKAEIRYGAEALRGLFRSINDNLANIRDSLPRDAPQREALETVRSALLRLRTQLDRLMSSAVESAPDEREMP